MQCSVRLRDLAEGCANWTCKNVVFDLPSVVEKKGFSVATKAILDNSRIKSIGWEPSYDMKNALNRTLSILSNR